MPVWFRVLVRSGFPFGRGNSEGRTLSPNGPVAFLCYSDAESWSRWYVYSLMGIVVGGHEFTLYGPPVERNSCHNHNSTFSFSAISGRRGSFPEWSFISYPSLTPSYCHTLPQHRAFLSTPPHPSLLLERMTASDYTKICASITKLVFLFFF